MALGERLRISRETAGLSLGQAAAGLGMAEERLASLEKGEAEPSISELRAAARFYRVAADALLETEEAAFTPRQREILSGLAAEFRRINRGEK